MLRRSLLLGTATSLLASQVFAKTNSENIVAFWDGAATSRIKYNPHSYAAWIKMVPGIKEAINEGLFNGWKTYGMGRK